MIGDFVRKTVRRLVIGPPISDLDAMRQRIANYRARGARIGDNVRLIGRLDNVNPHLITIGNSCVIGASAALLTHCAIRGARPVVIEDEVWIGFAALILPGVRVGTQSVIGAGAVVTKDVPPGSIVAGNPAKVLRPLTDEEKQHVVTQLREFARVGLDPELRQT